jgi:hypothetical protein
MNNSPEACANPEISTAVIAANVVKRRFILLPPVGTIIVD